MFEKQWAIYNEIDGNTIYTFESIQMKYRTVFARCNVFNGLLGNNEPINYDSGLSTQPHFTAVLTNKIKL
jgi:hypothetical protein